MAFNSAERGTRSAHPLLMKGGMRGEEAENYIAKLAKRKGGLPLLGERRKDACDGDGRELQCFLSREEERERECYMTKLGRKGMLGREEEIKEGMLGERGDACKGEEERRDPGKKGEEGGERKDAGRKGGCKRGRRMEMKRESTL